LQKKWETLLPVEIYYCSPALSSDEKTLYIGTSSGLLGNHVQDQVFVAIGKDGCVYFGINTGNPTSAFFALNYDGTLKWKFEPSDLPDDVPFTHFDIYSSPAIGSDGVVYFGQEFGRVYALNTSDGSFVGMAKANAGITWSSPAIDSKGVLYISDISGMVHAFQTGSRGLDTLAAWPKFRYDNLNSGLVHRPYYK